MPGWNDLRKLVTAEFMQSTEEGRQPAAMAALQKEFDEAGDDATALRSIWHRVRAVPIRADFGFIEPSDLPSIIAARPTANARRWEVPTDRDFLYDRLYGAWLGRCAGLALGKPVESFMDSCPGFTSRQRIKTWHTAISDSEWPITNYIPDQSPAKEKVGALTWNNSTRSKLAFAEMDDDICYTVVGQIVLRRAGKNFTTRDVAAAWLGNIPYTYTCGGCTMVFRNLTAVGEFHQGKNKDIDWEWIANNDNPYREWIGGTIRADPWGYAVPGDAEKAAELAWRDARMTHIKNGIYGEMFTAAMVASAFALDNPRAIVLAGLAEIPVNTRLAKAVRQTIELCDRYQCNFDSFDQVFDSLESSYGHYSPVHAINNAALVVASLLLGNGDFEKSIALSIMGGWDTDCNGATVGSIVGAMLGHQKLPNKWIAPLNDTLRSGMVGYDPIPLSQCAQRSVDIALGK